MQKLGWYLNRLRSMSAPEIGWRVRARVRQAMDRVLLPWRGRPTLGRIVESPGAPSAAWLPERGMLAADAGRAAGMTDGWRAALLAQANAVLENRVRLFDLGEHELGPSIDWNYEYKARKKAPMGFAGSIDYRDYSVTGDCKFVWELNRHHHLVILARAYRVTGDERYSGAAVGQMRSWLQQCPYGRGMNWRSPLELGIRLINWVCTLELIHGSAAVTADFLSELLPAVHLHLWEISRNYSRFSSANNHQIGEAAGVYVGSTYFPRLKRAAAWRAESRALLLRAIEEQTFADGGNREQAFGYHLFVQQFFLFAGICGRNSGDEFPQAYWKRLEKMFEFAAAMIEGGDPPMYGDADDGYVLDLGAGPSDARAMAAVGAIVFGRGDMKAAAGAPSEPAYWLFGGEASRRFEKLAEGDGGRELSSRALRETGIYVLQCGDRSSQDRISLTLDCGPLGYQSIAAHGHADALSVTLRVGGADVLADCGTFDYFTYGDWRDYFRSTLAHNTLTIGDQDQSERIGPFLWGLRAACRCLRWEDSASEVVAVGEHDGYRRLSPPVVHRRTVRLEKRTGEIEIRDELVGAGSQAVKFALHFGTGCRINAETAHRFRVHYSAGSVALCLDERLAVSLFHGSMEPKMGWISRGYHSKTASTTLVGSCTASNGLTLKTRLSIRSAPREGCAPPATASRSGEKPTGPSHHDAEGLRAEVVSSARVE